MCGIFGLVNRIGTEIDLEKIRILSDNMVHRGPDDEGIISKDFWTIGMRRLSIIDIAGGNQPISNQTNNIHLVANGEIYNYRELRHSLLKLGYQFKTGSDVEVILHLYEEYGYEGIHKLNGMFAFAIFDEIAQTLWIARDRLGIKPLYFSNLNGLFGFSSELVGLAKILNANLCEEAILDYLGYSYVPAPKTIFKGIYKLRPGEYLTLSPNEEKQKIYWSYPELSTEVIDLSTAQKKLHNLMKESVKMQLVSDVPLGIFLSGGVDSSAIAHFASESEIDSPLDTFNIDFEGKGGEDATYAKQISLKLNTNHHTIRVTVDEQFESLNELIKLMDEPMSDSAIVPTYMLSKAAKEKGIKVLLSGAGGDEIFGGYPRHFPNKKFTAGWFASLPRPCRKIMASILGIINPSYKIRFLNPARNFVSHISGVDFQFLSQIVKKQNLYLDLIERIDRDFSDASSKNSYPLMKLDIKDYLPNNVLSLTDKATMASSVEGRVPLLDHRIVELAFSLPEEINLYQGGQKGLFKKILTGRLPKKLLGRKKEGFNAPINSWVEKWPDVISEELLNSLSPHLERLIEKKIIRVWLSNDTYRKRAGETLYALFVLNKWLNSVTT